jgi:hypothetical protein
LVEESGSGGGRGHSARIAHTAPLLAEGHDRGHVVEAMPERERQVMIFRFITARDPVSGINGDNGFSCWLDGWLRGAKVQVHARSDDDYPEHEHCESPVEPRVRPDRARWGARLGRRDSHEDAPEDYHRRTDKHEHRRIPA